MTMRPESGSLRPTTSRPKCRLAAAALAHEREDLAARDVDCHVIDRRARERTAAERAAAHRKALARGRNADAGVRCAGCHGESAACNPESVRRSAGSPTVRRGRCAIGTRMPAAHEASVARLGRRRFDTTAIRCARTSRMETATCRRIAEIGYFAADRAQSGDAAERDHALDQPARIRMLRLGEDALDARVLDHLARVHHAHMIGELRDESEIVRDEDHRRAGMAADRANQIDDLRLHRHVERGRRLVEDQKPRPARHGHRDHHALPHAAGELMRIRMQHALRVADAELAKEVRNARRERGVAGEPRVSGCSLRDLLSRRQQRIEVRHRILKDVADGRAAQRAQRSGIEAADIEAVEHDAAVSLSSRRRQQSEQRPNGHRFAATRFANEADDLAGVDIEVDSFDGANDSTAFAREFDSEVATSSSAAPAPVIGRFFFPVVDRARRSDHRRAD
jgi:hypothetical protein